MPALRISMIHVLVSSQLMERELMGEFNAYYYSFTPTGQPEVDAILRAVAGAGKSYHHTDDWNEPGYDGGPSAVEKIQRAADEAAERFKKDQSDAV